ncbi:serine hydrolase domain-containing protein [Allomuricauda sp. NBRC 101325]|uniref:serine hydrolase domain-containing protein n=1 Tax=Allomuricauda sp. NBRC 101325 TaxID=1113758 RepID=UPI00249F9E80|nr:serine hydrolase domain-containing protein [Muricauda sp. NBRC 101325]GLU42601.1 serine hydrolase [Muricauda sp. NBRC 101325]
MTTKHPIPFKVFFIVLFLQVFTYAQELAKVPAEQVGMSSDRLAYLTQTFQGYVDQNRLPGASILVARKGKIAYFETFGKNDIENNIPMTEGSIFRIASQTKAIVSVGVMILQERGKLLITDQVGKFMPAFQKTKVAVRKDDGGYDIVNAERAITIRDLLTHTSGVSYGSGISADLWEKAGIQGWYFADRKEPIQTTINRMGDLPFEAQPGEKFEYGYNTDILGALIEVVSGEPLDVFLKKNILDPLGMTDTHFYLPEAKRERLAVVYSPTENGLEPAPTPGGMVGQGAYVDGPRTSFSGGAGLLSTSMDYAKFLQMMLNNGTFNGNRVLSRKSVELMTVNHLGKAQFPWVGGTGFGLGFSVVEDLGNLGTLGSVGEYGWGGAYHSSYWVDPQEEMVVVYFTQLIPSGDIDDHGKLRALIYQAIVD